MNTNHYLKALLISTSICVSASANAGFILSADSISGPSAVAGNINGLSNQSGLSSNFVSGITDFNSYIATNPTHVNVATMISSGYVSLAPFPVNLDVDLGLLYSVSEAVFWNWNWDTKAGTDQIEIFSSDDASFTTLTSLGTFNLNEVTGNNTAANYDLLDITDITTQYLRLSLLSNHGFSGGSNGVALVEVAFHAESFSSAAPEPSTYALLGLGLAGWQLTRKLMNN